MCIVATCKTLIPRLAILLALASLFALLFSCGGKNSRAPGILPDDGNGGTEAPVAPTGQPDLMVLKDAAGAPTGVRVYWWRVNEEDVIGYYLYRDTEPITEPDQSLRVNGGAIIHQPDEAEQAILFDDIFAAQIGETYYYRLTAVDYGWDESILSTQRSVTISPLIIDSFSPLRGKVGRTVTILGEYFGDYNDQTDAVYFTGVRNDKGPSSLFVDDIEANIVSWENDRVRASVPLGATIGPITVVSGGSPQQTNGDFECTSPYILSVSPDPATAGEEINFYGANFGPPDAINKLLVDDAAYGGVFTSWSVDHVVATLPGSLEGKLSKLELLVGTDITNPYYCAIIAGNQPTIDKITPGFGEAGEFGTAVEIQGSNFGSDINNVTVWFNGVMLTGGDIDYFSDTSIELTIPEGASRTGEVHVIVDDYGPVESNHYLYHTLPGVWPPGFDLGVVAGANVGMYSDVAYDASGQPYVVFGEKTHNSSGVYLYLAHQDAGEWVVEELASKYMNGEYRYPRVTVDTSGVVHFAYQWYLPIGGEVRYGTWDNGDVTDELVYSEGSMDNPGAYLDMMVLDDGQGGIDRLLVWSNELDEVMCGHKLDGASGWTTDVVYTADSAYSEQAGYYCSIDMVELVAAPPPTHAPSAFSSYYYVGISFGLYSPDYTPNWEVHFAYSDDLDTWYTEAAGSSGDPITETVMRWNQSSTEPFILWSTSSAVNWSYSGEGWTTEEVTSGGDHYGAALGLYIDEVDDMQYAYGNEGEDGCFYAFYDPLSNEWDSFSSEPIPDGRRVAHVGRGGAAVSSQGLAMSVYDPDMRDIALLTFNSSENWHWEDIADGFATPGYDLSNRAIVCDSNAVPHIVFGDIDPVTGERTLWMARLASPGPGPFAPPNYKGWEFDLIDSAPSGTLGHATMAIDSNDAYHVAYLKGNDVMYATGTFGSFSTPKAVFTAGPITTAPQIALGVNSPMDVNILVPIQPFGGWWWLYLLQSDDGMATWSEHDTAIASTSAITQYDLAMRHDGYAVAAFYETGPWGNGVVVWEQTDWSASYFTSMAGMNAGVTLTLDEDMHYCITATQLSNGTGRLLHWDGQASDYVLDQFTASADGSTTMSQWRTEYGPFISYTNEDDFGGTDFFTEGWLYWDDGRGFQEYHVWSFDGENVPLRHSVDAFSKNAGIFAYYADVAECRYLSVMLGPAP